MVFIYIAVHIILPIVKSRSSITFKIFTIGIRPEDDWPSYEKANGFARVTQYLKMFRYVAWDAIQWTIGAGEILPIKKSITIE